MRRAIDDTTLRHHLRAVLEGNVEVARHRLRVDHHSDPVDEAQWSEGASVAAEELDLAWRFRRDARVALDRLLEGSYGLCRTCGKDISDARLSALPWATRCIRCEALSESASGADETGPASIRDWLDADPD